ncbi:DUF3304 domain-containing protein [Neisseriaceae bacterium TC5R-5]|nr:DUF3304 domain-containing protein [Neisseriaceae bacterium TC5R-5]
MVKARFFKALLLATVLLVAACTSLANKNDERIGVSMSAVNHTDKFIYGFYINGAYGSNTGENSISGKTSCCVMIPRTWRPDLKVTVKWRFDGQVDAKGERAWSEKIVEIEPYDRPGRIFVHFFDNEVIRVVSTNLSPADIDHPVPFPGKQRKFPEPMPGKKGE